MVKNLSASQKYIKYTWFLTFTANHSAHPGLKFLHHWKSSMEWTKYVPNYENLSQFERKELKQSMEECYGVHIYNNWNTVKHILLLHIKHHITVLGTTTAIFVRDEYQSMEGNLCHNHLILLIDKSTMNSESERFIQDLVRASVLEIVKTDSDLPKLLENELLNSVHEVKEIEDLAN